MFLKLPSLLQLIRNFPQAYKRVGGMLHNGDKSHGIIGVIDVTELMVFFKIGRYIAFFLCVLFIYHF